MSNLYKATKCCRWCGGIYYAHKPIDKDGFCTKACKQAHYRAYKKYVTLTAGHVGLPERRPVTPKKRKGK